MSESRNIDIETLRPSRWERVCGRMDVLFGWVRKRDWLEAEAEVIECSSAERCTGYCDYDGPIPRHAVTFTYAVDGLTYKGMTISPVEVELHAKMTIRYNPRHPAQNNSFDSETEWAEPAAKVEEVVALGFLLFAVVIYFFARH
jgi:hypothetical protein